MIGVWKGKKRPPFSEEWRKNMSEAHKGHSGYWKGKKRDQETLQKISRTMTGRKRLLWERVKISEGIRRTVKAGSWHSYRGGITPLRKQIRSCFKYGLWRSDILSRDRKMCVLCTSEVKLIADHHPIMFAEILEEHKIKTLEEANDCAELWNIDNGRTLCEKCHTKYDKVDFIHKV